MISHVDSGPGSISAEEYISYLKLQPLDREGGWYRETWRSNESIQLSSHNGLRSVATTIYYLLNIGQHSRLHYLPGPEIYCHHAGAPLSILLLGESDYPDGREVVLGRNVVQGEVPQLLINGGVIQAAKPMGVPGWSLVSTYMSPGFEFEDYKEPDLDALMSRYPNHQSRILRHK